MTTNTQRQPGETITVVVTAVGALIGQGIIASLRRAGLPARVIGVDRDPRGIGRYWCDDFFAKPVVEEDSAEYLAFWKDLLVREDVDLVLPGLELDVLFFSRNRASFADIRTRIVLNDPAVIELAQDKWDFGEELQRLGLPAIPARLNLGWEECVRDLGTPLLLKPRQGNGSRGIAVLRDEDDFNYWSRKSRDAFLIQKFIGSDEQEFTVGSFGFGDGTALAPIIFRRKLSVAGNTQYAEVVDHPVLVAAVEKMATLFKPLGPTNYQFRMEDETPYLLEINPRFSSSTSLRAAFGYNEAAMSVEFYLHGRKPQMPDILPGRGWRYYEDYVVT
ncbi:ATP-grasp domain-containing protein [Pararhizobium sp. BT-229]|uniref:ATP-grasp domain-containing protein n=1 Tax=Pararhizobium sp. BT-229 TaxID=2986923 RepID=UPI0021F77201|nr:ATP-grasp domain-containing protein [Pararhizobium sp. BT-229]MCV9962647.1 ATP-grasp domain-containing protein [Pararhizobium sp. BT-229]